MRSLFLVSISYSLLSIKTLQLSASTGPVEAYEGTLSPMKHKLFLCFRPLGIQTVAESGGGETKISMAKPRVLDSQSSVISPNGDDSRKKGKNKAFSGAVKAVLFEISLRKKARVAGVPRLRIDSKHRDMSKSDSLSEASKSPTAYSPSPAGASSASSTSTSRSSSSSSSSSSNNKFSRTQSPSNIQQHNRAVKSEGKVRVNGCVSMNAGFVLVLISLGMMVCYGRLCAILFTSVCLYFLCRQPAPEKAARRAAETARENRKRVIMEGLLERKHHQPRGALNL